VFSIKKKKRKKTSSTALEHLLFLSVNDHVNIFSMGQNPGCIAGIVPVGTQPQSESLRGGGQEREKERERETRGLAPGR
jgi:hypothetical protein